MERTNKTSKSTKAQWKKIGGGSVRLGGRIIKPGQVFEADPNTIPDAFRDVIIPFNEVAKAGDKVEIKDSEYSLVMIEKGKWNIVDAEGKTLNDDPMPKGEAQAMLDEL